MSDYELDLDQILAEFNADAPEAKPAERPERAGVSRRERREAAEHAAEPARRPVREEPEEPEAETTVREAPARRRSGAETGRAMKKAPARAPHYEDDDYEEDEEPPRRDPDRRRPLPVLLCWLLFALCF